MVRSRHVRLVAWAFVALAARAQPALGQMVLMPGETRGNIPAAGQVLEVQGNQFADFRSWAAVSFGRADVLSQVIKLEARHPVRFFPVHGKAIARGMLFVDFCVPTRDAIGGCGAEPATPDTITALLTFDYGYLGYLTAHGFTSEATLNVTASVLDRVEQRYIHIDELKSLSVKSKQIAIKDVPIPIPGIEDPTLTRPSTFTLILKRGRVYRFQFAAAVTSTKGLIQPMGIGVSANADFSGPFSSLAPVDGFVMLRNLTIKVSPDVPTLEDLVEVLQDQVAALLTQIDQLRAEHQADLTTLREELGELRLATIGPGPLACTSLPPGPDWSCVAGGWVPPGHPSAGGSPGLPAPPVAPPPVACPGPPPATGWVCVSGGWVPPDHPLARGGGS